MFIVQGQITWRYGLPMAASALAGGYLAAHFSRRLPQTYVRALVTAIGFGLATYYFFREWLG